MPGSVLEQQRGVAPRRQRVRAEQLCEERLALLFAERAQSHRDVVLAVGAERWAKVLELTPRGADEVDRAAGLAQEVEQVEERRLGPVQVLDHEYERPLPREQLEHAADAPVQLGLRDLGRGIGAARRAWNADQVRERRRHRAQLIEVAGAEALEQRAELGRDRVDVVAFEDARGTLEDLDDGPVRDALAV